MGLLDNAKSFLPNKIKEMQEANKKQAERQAAENKVYQEEYGKERLQALKIKAKRDARANTLNPNNPNAKKEQGALGKIGQNCAGFAEAGFSSRKPSKPAL